MPRQRVATPLAILAALAAAAPDLDPLDEPVLLPRGFGSEVWLVNTVGGRRLVKVAVRWADGERVANAGAAATLAAAHGIRTPQVVATGGPWPGFGGRAYSVWEYLDGRDASEALTSMDPADTRAVFVALGEIVAGLHSIGANFYAGSVLDEAGQPTWVAAVRTRLARVPERYAELGLSIDPTVTEGLARIAALAERLSDRSRPVLVHTDLYLDNLIVGPDGDIVVLDFEHARFSDAGIDFVKPALFVDPIWPGAQRAMLDGYQAQITASELDQRVHLATGLELIWGIPFFHHWNDHAVVELYRNALTRWLAAT